MSDKPWYLTDFKKAMTRQGRIIPQIEQHLIRSHAAQSAKRDTDFLHPSEICKKDWCPRASWYVIKDGKRPDESIKFQRMNVFAEGTAIHDKWQAWLAAVGILEGRWECASCKSSWWGVSKDHEHCLVCYNNIIRYKEVPIQNEEFHLLGHADGIISDANGRAVLEVKSVGIGTLRFEAPELFQKFSKEGMSLDSLWKEIRTPFVSHLRQVNLYMYCLGIHDGVVLYEWKPTQEVKEFSIKFQPELVSGILAGCSTVKSALESNTIPMRPMTASLDATMCKNCPHYKRCWSIDEDHQTDEGHGSDLPSGKVPVKVRPAKQAGRTSTPATRVVRRST